VSAAVSETGGQLTIVREAEKTPQMQRLSTQVAGVALDPIHMLWVRGNLSRMERLSLRSFLAQGHPVMLYSYDPPHNVPSGVEVRDAREIVDEKFAPGTRGALFGRGTYGVFSDYFRYCLLRSKGGWWADLDVVAIKPWTGFPSVVVASTYEKSYGQIANGFVMRFPPKHGIIERCLEAIPAERLGELSGADTGPLLLHRILGKDGVAEYAQRPEVFSPVPWNANWQLLRTRRERWSLSELKQRLRRPHFSMNFTRRTVAVHLWNDMWRSNDFDKNAKQDPSCLYEKLQRQFNSGN
jgi:hypothetical protein